MFSRKATAFLMLLLVGVLMTAAIGPAAAQSDYCEGKTGGIFTISDAQSDTSLDPFVTSWHSWSSYALYATLFTRADDLSYIGFLADTWETSEDSKDLTINLIQTATFSDGTPVNAEALKWNLERYANPDTGSNQGAELIGLLEEVEITGEYSFIMHMSSAYAPIYYTLSGLEIVSPTAYEQYGVDDFGTHAVGAGPFLLEELNTGNYVSFVRNPDFNWAPEELYQNPGPTCLDGFKILFIGEQQTEISALETGEIQYAGIPSQNLADFQDNPDMTLNKFMDTGIRYVGFNTSKAPWDNQELRQAFAYAINRDEFVALAWGGEAVPLYQPLPPTIWGHNPDLDAGSYHYDPDKAKQMLDDLGYVDVNGDGLREQPDGSEWVVPMAVRSQDEWRLQAEVIDAQLRDVGIPLRIDLMESTALTELTQTGTHDLFLLLYGYQDPSILTYFFDPARKGGSNRAWFSTDELTALLVKADTDLNPETRYQTVTELSQYVIDASPWVFLAVPVTTVGVRNELKGWHFQPDGSFIYWTDAYFEQ